MDRAHLLRNVFFLLFTLSGFSGLIYESIWSHYLKLFLGHAAYAQTLVLVIFMGGMAIGSWLSSRYTARWKHLLLGYAIAEGVIGLCAIGFHPLYVSITEYAYTSVMPALGSPAAVTAFKWGLAGLLILPQSILLGTTFPLMSAGIIRHFPGQPGYTLGMLYFTNSLGAAAGVLVSGFVLIDLVGLPGTILTAGLINVALALAVWLLVRSHALMPVETTEKPVRKKPSSAFWYRTLLLTALITGLSSFIYEISWIRMLSLVLGASTHAFELMLSAFILGLAFGGFWIKRRIEGIKQPVRFLAIVQIAMGLLALLSLPLYGETFWAMKWLLSALAKTLAGYALFNFSSHLITLLVMLPATFCAGMTLPLITYALIKQGQGEKSIGAVYATNTVGAILGVVFAVHVGLPWLGLKNLMVLGAALDIGLGIALLWLLAPKDARDRHAAMGLTALGAAGLVATLGIVTLNPIHMASGVYREGALLSDVENVFQRDGKTATVAVIQNKDYLVINTNGKPDASVNTVNPAKPSSDEATAILSGLLPVVYAPQARNAAVIGVGSGLTTHALLGAPTIERVDTIEIEPAMVEGARHFKNHNERLFTDPRSRIHIDDAKSFFSTHNKRYDIIISEPSNPWVSGVSGLFSQEFYRHVTRHLTERGLFLQWLQLYEIDFDLMVTVTKALNTAFTDYVVYLSNQGDMLILASPHYTLAAPDYRLLRFPQVARNLKQIDILNAQDLELRKVGSKRTVNPLLDVSGIAANSDFFPELDQNAARTRFMRKSVTDLHDLFKYPLPVMELAGEKPLARYRTDTHRSDHLVRTISTLQAEILRNYFSDRQAAGIVGLLPAELRRHAEMAKLLLANGCTGLAGSTNWRDTLFAVSANTTPFLTPREMRDIWSGLGADRCGTAISGVQRQWLEFYFAVDSRDGNRMTQLAVKLLKNDRQLPPAYYAHLLATAMFGQISVGQHREARNLWYNHSAYVLEKEITSPMLRLALQYAQAPLHERGKSP